MPEARVGISGAGEQARPSGGSVYAGHVAVFAAPSSGAGKGTVGGSPRPDKGWAISAKLDEPGADAEGAQGDTAVTSGCNSAGGCTNVGPSRCGTGRGKFRPHKCATGRPEPRPPPGAQPANPPRDCMGAARDGAATGTSPVGSGGSATGAGAIAAPEGTTTGAGAEPGAASEANCRACHAASRAAATACECSNAGASSRRGSWLCSRRSVDCATDRRTSTWIFWRTCKESGS